MTVSHLLLNSFIGELANAYSANATLHIAED